MQILITSVKGIWDISGLIATAKWSGSYNQAARALDFSLLEQPADPSIPIIDCPLGTAVQLIENGETLFSGPVISRTKNTEGNLLNVSCFDRGIYLKRNKVIKKYASDTPEDVTAMLAEEYKLKVGELAKTGIKLARTFITPTSIYDIIATMYTLASKSNGKKYHIGFRGDALYVTKKEPDDRTLIIQGKSNLIAANVTESVADMVNAVAVYDANGNLVRTSRNEEWIQLYGLMQEALKQTKTDDKAAEAARLLEDGGPSQKITVDSLGNVANVTGGTVVVHEPYTELYGLFYIDSDSHEWKRGQYYNKLVLNFKAIMDAKDAGSLPNASGSKTAQKSASSGDGGQWDYVNKPV